MTYAIFRSAAAMLRVLGLALPGRRLPAQVQVSSDGRWGIDLAALGPDPRASRIAIDAAAARLGVRAEHGPVLAGRSVRIAECLFAEPWREVDPFAVAREHAPDVVENDRRGDWQPGAPGTIHVLAVPDEAALQRLVDALAARRVEGVELLPARPGSDDGCRYFVCIRGRIPASLVLMARRAWWGTTRGSLSILHLWPFEPPVPESVLRRLDWGVASATILLAPDGTREIVLAADDGLVPFAPLGEVANLRIPADHQRSLVRRDDGERLKVEVRVALAEPARVQALSDHANQVRGVILQLQRELDDQRDLLEEIEDEASESDLDLTGATLYEPLFLHRTSPGEVPEQLRRLLVGWTDQPEDLGGLEHVRVGAGEILGEEVPAGEQIHLVTTSSALGRSAATGLGYRLEAYAGRDLAPGVPGRFSLLSGWARHGLRLFVPHAPRDVALPYGATARRLAIYPRLVPCEGAAAKLADVVFAGVPNADRGRWCALLLDGGVSGVRVVRIPIAQDPAARPGSAAGFRPLTTDYRLSCNVSEDLEDAVALNIAGDAAGRLDDAISRAVDDACRAAVEPHRAQIAAVLAQEELQIQAARTQVHKVRLTVESARQQVRDLDRWLEKFSAFEREVGAADGHARWESGRVKRDLLRLGTLMDDLARLRRLLRDADGNGPADA